MIHLIDNPKASVAQLMKHIAAWLRPDGALFFICSNISIETTRSNRRSVVKRLISAVITSRLVSPRRRICAFFQPKNIVRNNSFKRYLFPRYVETHRLKLMGNVARGLFQRFWSAERVAFSHQGFQVLLDTCVLRMCHFDFSSTEGHVSLSPLNCR